MTCFIQTQKQKQLSMKVILMMYLNQIILQLYQVQKVIQEQVQAGLLIQSLSIILVFQNIPQLEAVIIKLPKELDHRRKGLINIQNIDDNECFKWSLVRYTNPAELNPRKITKANKDFAKKLDFKGIKFPVKIRDIRDIHKIKKKRISVFGYENKEKHPIYTSKRCCEEKR